MTMTIERLRELAEILDFDFECEHLNETCRVNEIDKDGMVSVVWLTGGHAQVPIDTIRLTEGLQWWEDRTIGEIVHYHNSHGRWVQGEIVNGSPVKQMLVTGLIGKWDPPQLLWDGTVKYEYHANKVLNGDVMRPSYTNMYEAGAGRKVGVTGRFHEDPTKMDLMDLSAPVPTPEQQRIIDKVQRLDDAKMMIEEVLVGLRNDFLEVS